MPTTIPNINQTISTVQPVLHRDTINPTIPATQDAFVQSAEAFFDKISEMTVEELNTLIGQLNSFRVAVNAVSGEIETASEEVEAAKEEALTALATLAEGAIDNINIANNKAFSNQFILNELISTRTAKATLEDADYGLFSDSSDTNKMKKISWSNIKATLISSFGVMISTLTAKTTPVDADIFTIGDSAATNASKKLTWANIKTALGSLFVSKVTSTDNAIVRFDGVTGAVQNSSVVIDDNGNLLLTSGTGGLGYGTGSGGTVTQLTSKSTSVTLNKPAGMITMNNAALAAGASASFQFSNSLLSSSDNLIIELGAGISGWNNYRVEMSGIINETTRMIKVTNISGGSLSESQALIFKIIKGANS